ncbi:MAG TPA: hypothetical protein PK014_07405 [Thermoanaerobaculia bacterium]|nr:hypothetical protein [Thermoanaerobaculia bacterium]HUM29927.1 hypothetical protein [Thermoanaerobaculia bacterium]HXK68206.1 hypothetical protein [Thermoanaerobaculia bacterium]
MKRIALVLFLLSSPWLYSASKTWNLSDFKAWSIGKANGVWITDRGLTPGPGWNRIVGLEELLVTDITQNGKDLYIATGTEGKIYRIRGESVELVADLDDAVVSAIAVKTPGELFATTLDTRGLLEIKNGKPETLPDFDGLTIRDLAITDGVLYVATSNPAALDCWDGTRRKRITEFPEDVAVVTLVPDGQGGVYGGTYGRGLLFHADAQGAIQVLWQDDLDEISQIALAPSGDLYFLSNASPEEESSNDKKEKKPNGMKSRFNVYRTNGVLEPLVSYTDKILVSLTFDSLDNVPLYGTAAEGEIYAWQNDRSVLVADLEDESIAGITQDAVITQESVAIYRRTMDMEHTYESDSLDAEGQARLGEVVVRASGTYSIAFRSGQTRDPGPTWSDWTREWKSSPCSPRLSGRYGQLRVSLESGTVVESVAWTYNPLNLAPRIESFDVLSPGEIYLKSGYQPQNIVIQATNPDQYGIFTTLDSVPAEASPSVKGKKAFMKGYRTFAWQVKDPNGDEVSASLHYHREGSTDWVEIFKDSRDTFFSWDTMVLPDGPYRFKLTISDQPSNPKEEALTIEEVSPLVIVDNHPPSITFESTKEGWIIHVTDLLSPLAKIEASRDGKPWEMLQPSDSILDSKSETFHVSGGMQTLVIRATDTFYNTETAALPRGKP